MSFDPEEHTLNRPHHENHPDLRGGKRRQRRAPRGASRPHRAIPMTSEGVPAAIPDAPKPSPVVTVSAASRSRFPWLPARVIAGSVWRGPAQERLRVDDGGEAQPWRGGPSGR